MFDWLNYLLILLLFTLLVCCYWFSNSIFIYSSIFFDLTRIFGNTLFSLVALIFFEMKKKDRKCFLAYWLIPIYIDQQAVKTIRWYISTFLNGFRVFSLYRWEEVRFNYYLVLTLFVATKWIFFSYQICWFSSLFTFEWIPNCWEKVAKIKCNLGEKKKLQV